MLNKELSQVYDGDKISSQITEYICSTFLDQNEQGADGQLTGNNGQIDIDHSGNVEEESIDSDVSGLGTSGGAVARTTKTGDSEVTSSGGDDGAEAEQRTLTASSGTDFRRSQKQGQESKPSVIVRLDRNTAKKLAAVAAAAASEVRQL